MAGDAIRWLHLSDFHVGKDDDAQRRLFDRIHEHVRERVTAEGPPDIVFITGDLAFSGKLMEFSTFYNEFLLPLQVDALGDDFSGPIFTVPGNHDVDRKVAPFFDREAICEPSSRFFDPTKEGRKLRGQVRERFQAYREKEESEGSHSPDGWLDSDAGAFSERVSVRGKTLGIAGINTSWLCKDDMDRHKLTPGVALLEAALKKLGERDATIVLGHHPLDWLVDAHVKPLRALLGEYGAIYLHGHLHENDGRREDGSGQGFLAIQAGACFQARDGEPWVNGLLWAEIDLTNKDLRLQPRHWNPKNRDWPLTSDAFPEVYRQEGTDWWCYPLPGTRKEKKIAAAARRASAVDVPEGWDLVDRDFLAGHRRVLDTEDVLLFFDGSVPSWELALAPEIPRRQVVEAMADRLAGAKNKGRPNVVLLVGPGGEGKSTAVLQTIASLVDADPRWRILWRADVDATLPVESVRSLPTGARWLIATDDADLIAEPLFAAVKALQSAGRGHVAFLLACRDTDWRAPASRNATPGHYLDWPSHAIFHREEVHGLDDKDAHRIVGAWQAYGEAGMGQLAGQSKGEAVCRLLAAAKEEAATDEGAFYGAMLKVRIGGALREHLRRLLRRLGKREIHHGVSLLDAYASIAAMHAEGLTFLSRPVLAQALAIDVRELKAKVLGPLGREAAVVGAGRSLLTRHRTIARCAVEVLEEVLEWEVNDVYSDLCKAAKTARRRGHFVPDLHLWDYAVPQHFLETGRPDHAIRVGRALVDADPSHVQTRSNLAKLYRETDAPEEAVRLFREYTGTLDRGSLYEWGVAEGEFDNQPHCAWLESFSLADQADGPAPDNNQAKLSLAGLGVTFESLFKAYNDDVFVHGRAAVGVLGLLLPLDPRTRGYFEKHQRESRAAGAPEMDVPAALDAFEAAVRAVGERLGANDELASRFPLPGTLTFKGLRSLIGARLRSP